MYLLFDKENIWPVSKYVSEGLETEFEFVFNGV